MSASALFVRYAQRIRQHRSASCGIGEINFDPAAA
jgi:hypothetical protein